MQVTVLCAGTHTPSATRELAADLVAAAAAHLPDLRPRWVHIRDHAADVVQATLTGLMSPTLRTAIDDVASGDGLIAVTPVFASSYAGIFKSFFDVLDPRALTGKPTLLGATGGSVRHSLVIDYALRPLLGYFRADLMPTGVFASPMDHDDGARAQLLARRVDRAAAEFAGALASRAARTRRVAEAS